MLRILDQTDENSGTAITPEMFGANLTLTTDVTLREDVIDRFQEAGISNLRYPGGSVTEFFFDISDIDGGSHNRALGSFESSADFDLIGFSDFMALSNTLGTSATLVVPTSVGFTQSAGDALLNGTYGNRAISAEYLSHVAEFVSAAMAQAQDTGVTIDAFQIGNEFWASGRMTAKEYGKLAAAVSQVIETTLRDVGLSRAEQPDIVIQTLSGAGIFSPNGDTRVFVDPSSGFVYEPRQIGDLNVPDIDELLEVRVPSQGKARAQNIDINEAFARDSVAIQIANGNIRSFDTSNAADAIDGITEHYYLDGGFDAVDTEEQFMFNQLEYWRQNTAGRDPDLPEVEFYITEWNVRRTGELDEANNRGLQQASMNIAIFHEMVTHHVTTAHFWPSLFDLSRSTSLICACRGHLTIAGEAYALLTQTVGMTPVLDFLDLGNIAIHGYASGAETLWILSERSGERNTLRLDFSEVRDPEATAYRVSWTELWDGGAGGQDEAAAQTLIQNEFVDLLSAEQLDRFLITMQAWSIIYMNVESVSGGFSGSSAPARRIVTVVKGDDPRSLGDLDDAEGGVPHHTVITTPRFYLEGGDGDDTLRGGADDDVLSGRGADDLIFGRGGADTMNGGAGNDTIRGNTQNDRLNGGSGNDSLVAQSGNDILNGHSGRDTLKGGGGSDDLDGGGGFDFLKGGTAQDILNGRAGNDRLFGNRDDDTLNGGRGNDVLSGGGGDDQLQGGAGDDRLKGGLGSDTFVFADGHGDDTIVDFASRNDDEVIDLSAIRAVTGLTDLLDNHATQVGADVLIDTGGGNSIRLEGVSLGDLGGGDFLF